MEKLDIVEIEITINDLKNVNASLWLIQGNYSEDMYNAVGYPGRELTYDGLGGIIKANKMLLDKLERLFYGVDQNE
ncbi:MAG: hypothetical protein LUG60_12960 [Erysipelotrichaceae bacterium]|nr:hypothetical protein [Erysipelotrichaceae bacterium]